LSHHYSTTHDVLFVFSGKAKLLFGGEGDLGRVEQVVGAGDAIVVPAGVSHRLLDDIEGGFRMVGSHPKCCNWDMCYGKKGEESQRQSVVSSGSIRTPYMVTMVRHYGQGKRLRSIKVMENLSCEFNYWGSADMQIYSSRLELVDIGYLLLGLENKTP
jgi:hypothetical protein